MNRAACLLALLLCLGPPAALAGPKADLWERWTRHDPASTRTIDHSDWTAFLKRHLVESPDGVNWFAYEAAAREKDGPLAAYVERLAAVPVSAHGRDEQFAYWVNLYNALTVQVVLEHWPVSSIRRITLAGGLFTRGPWGAKLIKVEGVPVSLDDIEHRILRPIWRDPRIHYAVNCASIGCPNLQPEAFTAANRQALLERGARAFVNHPRGVAIVDGRLTVSSLYGWYREDFGDSEDGVIAHIRHYADPRLRAALDGVTGIASHRYDWTINAAR